jgi:heme/copper-type cytochrome/quinol oxidase subunit 2
MDTSQTLAIAAAVLGLIPATIMATIQPEERWRAFIAWWVFGALLLVVALPMALVQYSRHANARSQPPPTPGR